MIRIRLAMMVSPEGCRQYSGIRRQGAPIGRGYRLSSGCKRALHRSRNPRKLDRNWGTQGAISMRTIISRWFMFGLLLGWALTHATVFGQTAKTGEEPKSALPISKIRAGL